MKADLSYTEPVKHYLERILRRVSIEVYDDTPPLVNLYILAQVDPEEWEDKTGTDVTNFPSQDHYDKVRESGKSERKRKRNR